MSLKVSGFGDGKENTVSMERYRKAVVYNIQNIKSKSSLKIIIIVIYYYYYYYYYYYNVHGLYIRYEFVNPLQKFTPLIIGVFLVPNSN